MSAARDAKPGGTKDPGEGTERRRSETAALTAVRKDATLRRKRLRREPSAPDLRLSREPSSKSLAPSGTEGEEDEAMLASAPEDIEHQVQAAVAAILAAKPIGGQEHVAALRALRQLLSNYDDPPYQAALAAGAVPALIAALQPPRLDATALEGIFEAAWGLTNLAVGDAEVVAAVVPAAPLLIAHLGGGAGPGVAEQAAWALGNIAGEDAEYRSVLLANGAVRPLAEVVVRAARALGSTPHQSLAAAEANPAVAAGATAAWALANLLRASGHENGEFMGTEGAAEAVIKLVAAAPEHAAAEAAWVLAYITAGPLPHLGQMVHLGAVPALEARLVEAVGASGVGQIEQQQAPAPAELVTPLLRSLGNIAGGGGAAAVAQLLAPSPSSGWLPAVVDCAQSGHHGVQREACWVLSNLAGVPGRGGVEALVAAGALPVLLRVLKQQPFHVRKEAAYALANVCAGGGGGTGDLEALNHLFGADVEALRAMVSLMRSADADAAALGLQFTEMLLRTLPSGVGEVEAADGIDALEALQFGPGVAPELAAAAAAVVNRYWGAEGAADEANA